MSKKLPALDPKATFVDVGSEHMHVTDMADCQGESYRVGESGQVR